MNKKYLSALLFGALTLASTGTFTSCKDYDDDIENLQGQITSNKDAIAALQKLVGEGKWVTAISPIENGFTVTMSDGSTQTVKGINGEDGKDGKDGTQWTIGEDGLWYLNGEKTEFQAVGKDGANGENGENGEAGKNGLTAPSPKINAEGMWVVYEFDAEKGEFVEKVTEVSAQGTSAYVVEKDGVYYLNVADEQGNIHEIALPSTPSTFTVDAPAPVIVADFETANWNRWESFKKSENGKALLAKYPELADIKKGSLVKQGGNLPLLVNPANVDLAKGFELSLQNSNGETFDVELSTPTQGLPEHEIPFHGIMNTRATGDQCFWTIPVSPALNEKGTAFVDVKNASLVVENVQGTVVKTPFSYNIEAVPVKDDVIVTFNKNVDYAEAIDLFAANEEGKAPIELKNEYVGKYIISLPNSLQVEKYGLSIAEDGKTLNIANMPVDQLNIEVTVNVIALGLNGSVSSKKATLTISQEIAASVELSDKTVVFNGNDQEVKWAIDELGLTAVQLDKVLNRLTVSIPSYIDADGEEVKSSIQANVILFNAEGEVTEYVKGGTWKNGEAKEFGVTVNGKVWVAPATYTLNFLAKEGTTVFFSAKGNILTELPTATTDIEKFIKLADAYVDAEGVLQVTGTPVPGQTYIEYSLPEAFVKENVEFADKDPFVDTVYDKENADDKSLNSSWNWISDNKLVVNKWFEQTDKQITINGMSIDWSAAAANQLYTKRAIRANIYFFGNKANKATYDFEVEVKSPIWRETAKAEDLIWVKEFAKDKPFKLETYFGASKFDLKGFIIGSKYVLGDDKDKEFRFFGRKAGEPTYGYVERPDFEDPELSNKGKMHYLLNSKSLLISLDEEDLVKIGVSAAYLPSLKLDANPIYLTYEDQKIKVNKNIEFTIRGWKSLSATANLYYGYNDAAVWAPTGFLDINKASDEIKNNIAVFNKYITVAKFGTKEVSQKTMGQTAIEVGAGVDFVNLGFVNEAEAKKVVNIDYKEKSVTPLTTTEVGFTTDQKVEMFWSVTDKWGRTTKFPFTLLVKTEKPAK